MSDLATLNSSLITDFLQTRTWFSILLLHSWVFSLQHKLLCVGSILYQLKLILHPFLDQYHRYLHFIINKRYLGTKLSNGCQLIWNINTTVINTLCSIFVSTASKRAANVFAISLSMVISLIVKDSDDGSPIFIQLYAFHATIL